MKRIRAFLAVFWPLVAVGVIIISIVASWSGGPWGAWMSMIGPVAWIVSSIGIALIVERIVASVVTGRDEGGIKAELKGGRNGV